ncbi:MAG TPA: pyridoxal-phosphate dependent enzyme [Polyangiaceae bacterium]|nr:pyridoxal-phosphate dependent enzyme [Polyangiaceae bacterium]
MPKRLSLAHLPTPVQHLEALDSYLGCEVWIKRDDITSGAAAGNKIRKLEFLLCEALARSATHILTSGGEQSNHARATAILAAQLRLKSVLLLATQNPSRPPPATGNIVLNQLAGSRIVWITPQEFENSERALAEEAARISANGERPYIIPVGGSNGLGALGYVEAMCELRQQMDLGLMGSVREFDTVLVACGSGGTAAGAALGARHYGVAQHVHAIAVSHSRQYFRDVIDRIVIEARSILPRLSATVPVTVLDEYRGPAYGVASEEQLRFIVEVANRTGLILDPVYTGKALFALAQLSEKPERVLFIHTGGLPGALAQAEALSAFARHEGGE